MTGNGANSRRTVGILIFPEVEVLDFCGPYEVFSVARLNEATRRDTTSPFKVLTVSETSEPVSATGGLRVVPDYDFDSCPKLDILVVPGGWGTRPLLNNQRYTDWIRQRAGEVERVTSVCTGSLLLANAGLLVGKSATTHWRSLDFFRNRFPNVTVERHLHVVEDGNVLTSAGISAGIDMALLLVKQFYGEQIARNTATYMEYPYPESNARRVRIGS